MKQRNLYTTLISVLALAIMIMIQFFLVKRILELQSRSFELQYTRVMSKVLDVFDNSGDMNVFGKTDQLMNSYSNTLLRSFGSGMVEDTLAFQNLSLEIFHKALNEKEELSGLLKDFMKKTGYESEFVTYMVITRLDLIKSNKLIPIYQTDLSHETAYPDTLGIPESAILANHYIYDKSNYRIEFDFMVDFSHKQQLVLKQSALSLTLSGLAILMVGLVFFLTYKNLLEEQRLSQSKTDFINNMTHELKTPLSTISIATKSLENEKVLDDRQKILDTARIINRQNRQLAGQINHLLEISMWEKGQFDLNKQWTETASFFHDLINAFKVECRDRAPIIEENYDFAGVNRIFIDETQLTVALHNLLINAVKYGREETRIRFSVQIKNDMYIQVGDNGIGIAKEHQKHVFEKFYRVPTGNIHKVKGLGLGLFYVKQIVEAHRGSIELVSKPGSGTQFTIKLPIHGKNQDSFSRG